MKLILLSFLVMFMAVSAKAEDETRSEATAFLNCDHSVAGTTCPAKMASTACLTCDTKEPRAVKTSNSPSESDK